MVTSGVASFDVARIARQPGNRRLVAFGRQPRAAGAADRAERVVVDLAARHHRDLVVEQRDQRAQQARLRLAAQAEQDEVVPRQQGVDQLRDDGVVVADDAGEEWLARAQFSNKVLAHLLVDTAAYDRAGFDGAAQLAHGGDRGGFRHTRILLG